MVNGKWLNGKWLNGKWLNGKWLPFPPHRIIPSEVLKAVGMLFQQPGIVQQGFDGQTGSIRQVNIGNEIHTHESCNGFERHAGCVGFSVSRIACDVGCPYHYLLQQFLIEVWLSFPSINHGIGYSSVTQCLQQCHIINHSTS